MSVLARDREDARGDDDGFVPSLRNQHYSYLVRQMRGLAEWHRLNVDAERVRFLDSLDEEERSVPADYLSRMRGPTRDRSRLNEDGTVSDWMTARSRKVQQLLEKPKNSGVMQRSRMIEQGDGADARVGHVSVVATRGAAL